MTSSLSMVAYFGAAILFILCLGGLSNQETSRRGNLYGMIGMAIAVLATVFGTQVTPAGLPYILAAMVVVTAVRLRYPPSQLLMPLAFGAHCGSMLALTGTPVENHLGDLHGIMSFLNPGLLGSAKHFEQRFGKPIQREVDA